MADLSIDLVKLRHNINYIGNYCSSKKLELLGIIKGGYAHPLLITEFQKGGIKTIGMSKTSVAEKATRYLDNKPIYITLPSLGEHKTVAKYFRASFNSELPVIRALAETAAKNQQLHEIMLMVDNGDRREGVMPEDVLGIVKEILSINNPYIRLCGLGANLGCCSGTLPDDNNIALLQELAFDIETRLGYGIVISCRRKSIKSALERLFCWEISLH